MSPQLRITLAQLNFTVGDIEGNTKKIIKAIKQAKEKQHADAIIFPELAITGYPPEDLLYRHHLNTYVTKALEKIQRAAKDIIVCVGYPYRINKNIYNAAACIKETTIIANAFKQLLPNTSVFDEVRYFTPGNKPCIISIKNIKCAILICEDIWFKEPLLQAKEAGAQCVFVLNASPYSKIKSHLREKALQQRIKECHIPIFYINQIGGQDDLIFDGYSLVLNQYGENCAQAEGFKEQLLCVDMLYDNKQKQLLVTKQTLPKPLSEIENIYQALLLGIKDYTHKNGFTDVLLGLSGGIDSSLTLTLAADALGPEHVTAVMMPSQYTAKMSVDDARKLTKNLGVKLLNINIQKTYETFLKNLFSLFEKRKPDNTEQNIQARTRAIFLMALSNKFNQLLLTTGNKSEYAVGYTTLYGDMAGGFAVLKDVYKTLVYQLANYRNQISPVIPQRVIDRPPSAELAPEQTDQDTLPPYSQLDQILELFLEKDYSIDDIIKKGFPKTIVKNTVKMILRSEFKRRQSAPGIRITEKMFGRDRRYPITSGYLKNIIL